jgi:hypothetical protein
LHVKAGRQRIVPAHRVRNPPWAHGCPAAETVRADSQEGTRPARCSHMAPQAGLSDHNLDSGPLSVPSRTTRVVPEPQLRIHAHGPLLHLGTQVAVAHAGLVYRSSVRTAPSEMHVIAAAYALVSSEFRHTAVIVRNICVE